MANERDRHLTEEELLRYADGEIPEGQSWVAQHLLACWDCRGRLSDLEAAIKAIVQFRNNDFLPAVPGPPRPWGNLEDLLRSQTGRARQRRFWARIFSGALSALHHHRAATAGIAVLSAMLAGIWLLHPPAASASAELAKASAAESAANLNSTNRVVHQRLRVRRKTRHDSRETMVEYGVWRGPNLFRVTASSTSAPILKELEDVYETNGLNWHEPLSAIAFSQWRTRIAQAQDALEAQPDSSQITVRTIARQPAASIKAAEITFRTSDYHAIHEHLETPETDYEITETHWDLVSRETSLVTPRAERTGRTKDVEPASGDVKAQPILNSDDVEMEIRHDLHHLGADLGDPITVGRGPQGEVVVEVLGVTSQRLAQIEDLLHRYPPVILDRTGTLLRNSLPCDGCAAAGPLIFSAAPSGELDQQLRKHLGDTNEVEAFTHKTLTLSDRAMSYAYALKVLASRYDETAKRALSPNSRQELSEMIVAHAAEIASTASELEIETRSVLRELGTGGDLHPNIPEQHAWQKGAMEVFAEVQTVDRLLKTAFTKTNSSLAPTEALQRLAAELSIENTLLTRYRAFVEKESDLK
jgi:hypothetical protein